MVFVGILLLIIATASAHYYHMKLLDVTQTMAKSVVTDTFWEGNQWQPKPTAPTVNQDEMLTILLQEIGLPASTNDRTVYIKDDGNNNCVVEIEVRGFPIFGCGILPQAISLKAAAAEPWHLGHSSNSVMVASSMGPAYMPAFRPSQQGAPPANLDPNGTNIWCFPQASLPPWGYAAYGLNYGGYGSSAGGGSPTYTGDELAGFSPTDIIPGNPPPPGAYP
jgi:hypothetical protein